MAFAIYYIITVVPTSVLRALRGFSLVSFSMTGADANLSPVLPVTLRLKKWSESQRIVWLRDGRMELSEPSSPPPHSSFWNSAVQLRTLLLPSNGAVPFGKWMVIPYKQRPVGLKIPLWLCFHSFSEMEIFFFCFLRNLFWVTVCLGLRRFFLILLIFIYIYSAQKILFLSF